MDPTPKELLAAKNKVEQYVIDTLANKKLYFSFRIELEKLYCAYSLTRNQTINRYYPFVGAVGILLFLFADRIVIPNAFEEILAIRLLGTAVILFMVTGLIVAPKRNTMFLYHLTQSTLCAGTLAIHFILLRIGFIAANLGEYHYQNGTTIAVIFLCTVLRVDFRYILPTVAIMWLSHIYTISEILNASNSQIIEQLFNYSLIAFISCLVNARMDHEVRKTFLQSILLESEQRKLEKAKDELHALSISDGLTGLKNRRGFDQGLSEKWASASRNKTPLTLLMVDIDYFKRYNDALGHPKGDDALILVAKVLSAHTKRPDDLCARWGGEEFALLLPQTDIESGVLLAESIRNRILSEDIVHPQGGADKKLTVSIGIATLIPDGQKTPQDLLKLADKALYSAKKKGRNQTSVDLKTP